MRGPNRYNGASERSSPEVRRRLRRAAALRPLNLMVLVVGGIFFALSLIWWAVPLTLLTYITLVFLAPRDPLFRSRVLGEHPPASLARSPGGDDREASPEQRADKLPPGETRRRVEEALEAWRRTLTAIKESDDMVRGILCDVAPKLYLAVQRLAEVAEKRERIAREIQTLEKRGRSSATKRPTDTSSRTQALDEDLRAADAGISEALGRLSSMRTQVVRISTESESVASREAAKLNADLDEINLRLDALSSVKPLREPGDH